MGTGRPPVKVHAGDCHMLGSRHRAVGRDEARRARGRGRRWRACPSPSDRSITMTESRGPAER
ncbi:DUF6233 domain-containing protein [Streptomyces sp. NPDC049936]|uniref:DUF6233 domain-containing protein n=1 Tax=Streptomyces sp. NPDC049936 TaxID=3365599 RepID=UPI0037BCED35